MQYFGTFDTAGLPTAFYTTDLFALADIPTSAVEITREQWGELIDNAQRRKIINGQIVVYEPPAHAPNYIVSAAQACAAMDDDALLIRLGIEPGLYERVREICLTHPYKPFRHFFERANNWEMDSQYIQGLAYECDLSLDQLRALFVAAQNY